LENKQTLDSRNPQIRRHWRR